MKHWFLSILALGWTAAAFAEDGARAEQRAALAGVLHFWADRAPDPQDGGFNTFFDGAGQPTGTRDKYLVMQARLTWLFAAAHRHGWRDRDYEALARRGMAFLRGRLWDETHGGFVWCVGADGSVKEDYKRTYGQGFALYALAECARAFDDAEARAWAVRIFDLLLRHAREPGRGYREYSLRDWAPDATHTGKSMDGHMHLLECFTTLAQATGDPLHRAALREVVDLLLSADADPSDGYRFDDFQPDWTWSPRPEGERTMYGLNVELAWLLDEAAAVLPERRAELRRYALGLIDHTLAFGFDAARGGIALYGAPTGRVEAATHFPPKHLEKSWWPQAEALVAFTRAAEWTGDPRYRDAAARQWAWLRDHQIDPANGEWHETLSWDGTLESATKGNHRKAGYHNGRALLEVLAPRPQGVVAPP